MAAAIKFKRPIRSARQVISVGEVVALGASTTGTIVLAPSLAIPAKAMILRAVIRNGGAAAATLATLTAQLGDSGDPNKFVLDGTVFAANAANGGVPVVPFASQTAETTLEVLLTGNANLSTITGLGDGLVVEIDYIEGT